MYFGFARRIRSATSTRKSIPLATCNAAAATITDVMISITSIGGEEGARPQKIARTASFIPPAIPKKIPPNLVPKGDEDN